MADGDVRKIVSRSNKIDDAWRLRVLHEVVLGLQQLHGQQIAHQDLKPSNVLLFEKDGKGAKIGDLGQASRIGANANHDSFVIAGAKSYAPPEQAYGIRPESWMDRRESCDLYHFGCLVTYLFAGITPTVYYLKTLSLEVLPTLWKGEGKCDYPTALPILSSSFTSFVEEVRQNLPPWIADEMTQIIINICTPDYTKRGDPDARKRRSIGIETFVSRFDRLAKRALVETRK